MAEGYIGIKFKINLINDIIIKDPRIEELKHWCQIFDNLKLAPPYEGGSYGNLSFREHQNKNIFIITGTQIGLKSELSDDKFVRVLDCDLKTQNIYAEGKRNPSSESMLHYAIYQQRKDVNAIFHGHSTEILNNAHKLNFRITIQEEEYGTIQLVNRTLEILDNEINFFIIKNHGFFAIAQDMQLAGKIAIDNLNKCLKINKI